MFAPTSLALPLYQGFFKVDTQKSTQADCIIACVPMWLRGKDLIRLAAYAVPGPGLGAPARQRRGCGDGGFAASAPGGAKPPSQRPPPEVVVSTFP